MLAQIVVWDGIGTDVPTAPGGWTSIRHDFVSNGGNRITSWLYYKVAGASEPSLVWMDYQLAMGGRCDGRMAGCCFCIADRQGFGSDRGRCQSDYRRSSVIDSDQQ